MEHIGSYLEFCAKGRRNLSRSHHRTLKGVRQSDLDLRRERPSLREQPCTIAETVLDGSK